MNIIYVKFWIAQAYYIFKVKPLVKINFFVDIFLYINISWIYQQKSVFSKS